MEVVKLKHLSSEMDVFFDIPGGTSFSIEVDYFDTMLNIKEKIQKYQNIPISKQALIFNGQLLQDDGDIWKYEIFQNSRIQLLIADDTKVPLEIKTHDMHFPIQMDKNDTVLKLKEILQQTDSDLPLHKFIFHVKGIELQDNQLLRDCDNNEIEISLSEPEPPQTPTVPTPTLTVGGRRSNTLIVVVLSRCRTHKIYVKVNPFDKVGELKKELQELNQKLKFPLPKEGYLFFYKQKVMYEDRSFYWHRVAQGDTIEIFKIEFSLREPESASTLIVPTRTIPTPISILTQKVGGRGSNTLMVAVLSRCGTHKIFVEVNPYDKVGELKKELQELNKKFQFPLPKQSYFFIHKQSVMYEDRSFHWHCVVEGDTIEVFNGHLTDGSTSVGNTYLNHYD